MGESPMSDATVVIPSRLDENGNALAYAVLTSKDDTREKIINCDVRPVVPIIFLPGVMGTNLQTKDDDGIPVWTPPNLDSTFDKLSAFFSLLGWWSRGPAARQTRLNPLTTRVDDSGPIRFAGSDLQSEEDASAAASQRGKIGVQQTFEQAGFNHQNCFKHPWPRWATLYAIGSIAQVIPEFKQRVK
jgi:hypothetical protein